MTRHKIELARHALGLPNKRHRSYRNHFVARDGHNDCANWHAMVMAGFARQKKGSGLSGGDDVFWLTEAGAKAALKHGEKLCPEDFPQCHFSWKEFI